MPRTHPFKSVAMKTSLLIFAVFLGDVALYNTVYGLFDISSDRAQNIVRRERSGDSSGESLAFVNCPSDKVFYAEESMTSAFITWDEMILDNSNSDSDSDQIKIEKIRGPDPNTVQEEGSYIVVYEAKNEDTSIHCSFLVEVKVIRCDYTSLCIENGGFDCSRDNVIFGTTCDFTCNVGYTRDGPANSKCLSTGLFQEPLPACERTNYCKNLPCQNGGTCYNLLDDFVCCCVPTFIGKTCAGTEEAQQACLQSTFFRYDSLFNWCYHIIRGLGTSLNTNLFVCRAHIGGDHFVFIENEDMVRHFREIISTFGWGEIPHIFIDGTDEEVEGIWKNYAGQPMTYFNWASDIGEPDNTLTQNCIALSKVNDDKWIDIDCDQGFAQSVTFCVLDV